MGVEGAAFIRNAFCMCLVAIALPHYSFNRKQHGLPADNIGLHVAARATAGTTRDTAGNRSKRKRDTSTGSSLSRLNLLAPYFCGHARRSHACFALFFGRRQLVEIPGIPARLPFA